MPSKLNAYSLCAVMLAALLQCASGAPFENSPTDSPAGDPSGDDGEIEASTDQLRNNLQRAIDITKALQTEFKDEFQGQVDYESLKSYQVSSLPEGNPRCNFNKEPCLHRLVRGLLTYTALLKYVEKEYPGSTIPSLATRSSCLITEIAKKMRAPGQVIALTSSQDEQQLSHFDSLDSFHRKMTAHAILYHFHYFLVDISRLIEKAEKPR
uniref:interleukin-6-like n=1 Tax=Scatophagus argus TaxID=75038 RepID=UPI001ED84D7B|nr:interleukin-6-like [Scatophagus argus]